MKIGIITTGFAPDEKITRGDSAFKIFVKELSLRPGIEVTVFALYYPERKVYSFYNSRIFSFGLGKSRLRKLSIWRECIKKFNEIHSLSSFDLVQSFWLGESGQVASMLSKSNKIPLLSVVCGGELVGLRKISYGSQLKLFQRYFVENTLKSSSVVVTGCEYMYNILLRHSDGAYREKARIIPFGVDDEMFKPQEKVNSGKVIRLINIANTFPVKSHTDLFKAVKLVTEQYTSINLFCAGAYGQVNLPELARQNRIEKYVQYTGWTDYEKIPDILNESDIYVLSSLHEAFNMSVAEAALCGLPVVSTDVGVARELTSHIVNPGDYEELAAKIIKVIENIENEKNTARAKAQLIRDKFSVRTCVDEYLKLYTELISENN